MDIVSKIISRESEVAILTQLLSSNRPEFLAVYGRRRVGKTFLIRNYFASKNIIFFDAIGAKDASLKEQVKHFTQEIGRVFYNGIRLEAGKNWDEAFKLLTDAIGGIRGKTKIVLFFDEIPWMATKNSKFLQSLDYYWNQHWSKDGRVKLIICGSSASWIIEKIINNKGGLHNRLTHSIYLQPFNLYQTKEFLEHLSIKLNHKQLVEIFMAMGGVPYYLSKLERGLSSTQIIEKLAFRQKSFLLEEFDNLFASLFSDPEVYIEIMRTISSHRYGIGQEALLKTMGKALHGKGGIEKLKNLTDTSFIMNFKPHMHKAKGIYYKVIDEYSLFYFYWIESIKDSLLKKGVMVGYWDKLKQTPSWKSWSGLAFESICYKHLPQIMQALHLSPTAVPNTWRYVPKKGEDLKGAQIDLLFDRDDDTITVCEIKYCDQPFVIDKEYAQQLQDKIDIFKQVTRSKKQIFLVLIASNGVKTNTYSKTLLSGVVTLEDLFKS